MWIESQEQYPRFYPDFHIHCAHMYHFIHTNIYKYSHIHRDINKNTHTYKKVKTLFITVEIEGNYSM